MEIAVQLDVHSDIPLYKQLVEGMRSMISSGQLVSGQKLPSSRELAKTLAISRFTASKAYEELIRQGCLETQPASGTFVCATALHALAGGSLRQSIETDATVPVGQLSQYGFRVLNSEEIEGPEVELFSELNYSAPGPAQLPQARWQEMLVKASRTRLSDSYIGDVLGHEGLRRALAAYLGRNRGMRCSPEQIAIFPAVQPGLDMLSRIILDEGDLTAVENPGFPGARRTFASCGARVHPVPVDSEGLQVEHLIAEKLRPKIIYVTPSHHDPSGAVLSAARRKNLLAFAHEQQSWIIEDDFDSQFRYGEKPTLALQGMDENESVIFICAFWKIMFPLLRIGFAVLPPRLVPVIRRAKALVDRDYLSVEHEALMHFINEGHLERHIGKIRGIYTDRRQTLIKGLNENLPSLARIDVAGSGTHLFVRFDSKLDEDFILHCAADAGLPMVSTGPYYVGEHRKNEMLMPFAHLDKHDISAAVEKFGHALKVVSQ